MSWATRHIQILQSGLPATFCPRGRSMEPRIHDGQRVTVVPITDNTDLSVGMVVLCIVKGRHYLHLIKAKRGESSYLIGNNKGGLNGWIHRQKIFGRLVE